jgi:hypothetical protein
MIGTWFQDPTIFPLSSESHFLKLDNSDRQQLDPFLPFVFIGVYYFFSLAHEASLQWKRLWNDKNCFLLMFHMGHCISYHSVLSGNNTSLQGLFDESFVYCLPWLFSRLHWTSFHENASPYWVLNNSYFLSLGGILNSTSIHIYYVGGRDDRRFWHSSNYFTSWVYLLHTCWVLLCYHEIFHTSTSSVPNEWISWQLRDNNFLIFSLVLLDFTFQSRAV